MARIGVSARETAYARFELLDVGILHCHEQLEEDLVERTIEEIKRDGYLKRPILVADHDFVILDGHHRYEALKEIGCRRVPAYVIDYFSEIVHLGTWPQATVKDVTKEEVIKRGVAGELFPPKTTRHTLRVQLPDVFTDLEDLM